VAGLAERADDWILARLDLLRPRRPDAGFRHELKHKWLLAGDGLEVTEVLPGSPAAVAGLEVGDRIRAVDSEKGTAEMDRRVRTWWFDLPGRRVRLEVERGKARRTIECTVERPRRWPGTAAPDGSVQER
jgi:S1-C subfamily serine protease